MFRPAAVVAAALLLTGCTTANRFWDQYMSFDSTQPEAPPPPAAVVASVPPPSPANGPDPFCMAVAQKDVEEGGFDPATQQRMATRSYNQCVGMFRSAPAGP